MKKLFSSFHPSCIYNHHPSNHCYVMREIMYNTCALFIVKLSVAVRSELFILHPPDKSVTICVDTASYHQVTCVVCKHDRKCRSCEYWYVIRVLLLLLIYFNQIWCKSGYSSESDYKSKVKEKPSRFPRMIGVSFIGKMHKLVHVRNRCRYCMNNVIKLYHYWADLFSVFRLWPHFTLLTTVYRCLLNKQWSV